MGAHARGYLLSNIMGPGVAPNGPGSNPPGHNFTFRALIIPITRGTSGYTILRGRGGSISAKPVHDLLSCMSAPARPSALDYAPSVPRETPPVRRGFRDGPA